MMPEMSFVVLRGPDALVDLVEIVMRPIVLECFDAA